MQSVSSNKSDLPDKNDVRKRCFLLKLIIKRHAAGMMMGKKEDLTELSRHPSNLKCCMPFDKFCDDDDGRKPPIKVIDFDQVFHFTTAKSMRESLES